MIKKKFSKSREEINVQSRLLKRKRKHKGLPSGSRVHAADSQSTNINPAINDPRIGSKKLIPLVVDTKVTSAKPTKTSVSNVKPQKLSPEKELEQLESNLHLNQLLDLIDEGQELSAKQQQELNKMLDRIDELMTILGLSIDDDEDDQSLDETQEDVVKLLKQQ